MREADSYRNKNKRESTGNDIIALKTINKQRTNHFNFFSKILSPAEQTLYYRQELADMPFDTYVWLLWSIKESVYKYAKRTAPSLVFAPTKIDIRQIDPPLYPRPHAPFTGKQWQNSEKTSPDDYYDDYYQGMAHFGTGIYYFRSKVYADVIATVVGEEENVEKMQWGIQVIDDPVIDHPGIDQTGISQTSIDQPGYDQQSKAVRAFVLARLNTLFSGDGASFGDAAASGDPSLSGDSALFSIGKSPLGYPIVFKGAEELNIPVSLAHHERFIAYSFLLKHGCQQLY